MCSEFLKRMENYYGELADIVLRSSGSSSNGLGINTTEWHFPSYYPNNCPIPDPPKDFGNPFTHLRDPLLHDIDGPGSGSRFQDPNIMPVGLEESRDIGGKNIDGSISLGHKRLDHDDETKTNSSSIFSRMLHISPNPKLMESPPCNDSPVVIGPAKGPHALARPNSCLVEGPVIQISSQQNMGVKKRKNQSKKVICIPAPAPAHSRPTGEIVPSDLWAWRKYGQKPIKGSPYPRGYYRCSSSKGCMARKQVERSRTDSNMLVITYTSEHNHPWPTQRNALAGSTRAHHQSTTTSKNTNTQAQKIKNPTTDDQEKKTSRENAAPVNVKEEVKDQVHNPLDIDDNEEFDEDRFFADLGEINEAHDPLDFLFKRAGDDDGENTGLDPFSLY